MTRHDICAARATPGRVGPGRWGAVLLVVVLVAGLLGSTPDTALGQEAGDTTVIDGVRNELASTGYADLSVEYHTTGDTLEADRDRLIASLPTSVEVVAFTSAVATLTLRVVSLDDVEALRSNPLLRSVALPPTDALFVQMLGQSGQATDALPVAGADQMHQLNLRGEGQVIALVDSGVDSAHPDLRSSVVFERCEIPVGQSVCPNGSSLQTGPGSALDDEGHGTNIAGILTGDGLVAPVGVAPAVAIEAYKVGGANGVDLSDALLALDYILVNRPDVRIVNFSIASNRPFFGPCPRSLFPAFHDIVVALRNRGTLVIAPTGNQSTTGQTAFPACLEAVVGVAGTSQRESIQFGSNIDGTTDLSAPAQNLATTGLNGSVVTVTGTSFAAPIVAACMALVMQEDGVGAEPALARLAAGRLRSARGPFSVPWVDCAPRCGGRIATVNLELGEEPTAGDDVVLGTRAGDVIIAGQGDDLICALDGDDQVVAGFGDDLVLAGRGDDTVFGGAGRDVINGQIGSDRLDGGDDDDLMYGSLGHDIMDGGPGDDRLHGRAGRDELRGGPGNDSLYGGSGSDVVSGGPGDDYLQLDRGWDRATGDDGNDRIRGGGGWDGIDGGPGDDRCDGGSGIDQMSCEVISNA